MEIELYTRKGCGLCADAKQFLKCRLIPFKEHVIDETINRDVVLSKFPDAKKLPVVVIDGTWIGGKNELAKYILSNQGVTNGTSSK